MEIRSLGLRTELIFHRFEGDVLDRGDHLVVRTPSNPHWHWGNYLLFPAPPAPGDFERWEGLFLSELGDMPHRVFAWDRPSAGAEDALPHEEPGGVAGAVGTGPGGEAPVDAQPGDPLLGDVEPFLRAGLRVDRSVVLAASAVHDPPRPNREIEVRPLLGDDDWGQALALGVACRDPRYTAEEYGEYLQPKLDMYRRMQARAYGSWFGAFLDGRMVADLGIFGEGEVARYQSVKTHPDFRRRGICGTAVAAVGRWGLEALGARRLVMMADPGYHAARIYESVGFAPVERLAGLVRP